MPEAARTLVKSPPELWAEVSDPTALARHLGAFGDIRITRLDPEATVAWEGDRASGTVALEPTGWGTKVTVAAEPEPEPVEEDEPAPPRDPEPAAAPRRSLLARLLRRRAPQPAPAAAAAAEERVEVRPSPEPVDADAVLAEMLASLGAAHHRPFSRGRAD